MNKLSGVGLLKVGTDIHDVREFYVVIVNGVIINHFTSYHAAQQNFALHKRSTA